KRNLVHQITKDGCSNEEVILDAASVRSGDEAAEAPVRAIASDAERPPVAFQESRNIDEELRWRGKLRPEIREHRREHWNHENQQDVNESERQRDNRHRVSHR